MSMIISYEVIMKGMKITRYGTTSRGDEKDYAYAKVQKDYAYEVIGMTVKSINYLYSMIIGNERIRHGKRSRLKTNLRNRS